MDIAIIGSLMALPLGPINFHPSLLFDSLEGAYTDVPSIVWFSMKKLRLSSPSRTVLFSSKV